MGLSSSASVKLRSEGSRSSVTLLIPYAYERLLEKRKRRLHKNTAQILELLMKRHQRAGNLDWTNNWKLTVLYQNTGMDLQRCDFLVDSFIWHQFKTLARHYNVSMCWLFTAFLKSFGTPEKNGFTWVVKSYQKLEIAVKTALRLYKTSKTPSTLDTS